MFNYQPGGFNVFRASRQVSKSTALACRQWLMARVFRSFKSLYIVPRADQLATYANRFREIEQANRYYGRGPRLRQSFSFT